MTAADLLIQRACEYEARMAHEQELDELAREQGVWPSSMSTVWAAVALVLREVALALEETA